MTQRRETDQDKAWPPNTPGAQEAEDGILSLTTTPMNITKGLGEQTQNSYEVHKIIYVSPTYKYQLSERYGKQYNALGLQRRACFQTSRHGCRGWD